LRTLALNRAAKRYARELPGQLRRAHGDARQYTPVQIRRAVSDAGLDEAYVALAYAGHLSETEFKQLGIKLPNAISYAEARALLARYGPLTGFAQGAADRKGH
jgi:hypothetical protein